MTIALAETLIPWIDDRLIQRSAAPLTYEATKQEIIEAVKDEKTKWQVEAFAQRFKGKTRAGQISFLKQLHQFIYTHFPYKADGFGKQEIKQPAICFYQRSLGSDCKSLTNFICAILFHLNIKFGISILVYEAKQTGDLKFIEGHVSPVFWMNNQQFIIDATLPRFNQEVDGKYIKSKEIILCY